jgi:hypothetical protein
MPSMQRGHRGAGGGGGGGGGGGSKKGLKASGKVTQNRSGMQLPAHIQSSPSGVLTITFA